jgi:Nucleotidyl transferase AbiEii toxin, Type IV TA system
MSVLVTLLPQGRWLWIVQYCSTARPPNLLSYPVETVVAEKFEASVSLGIANTRLKDFYDLWMIANTFEFDSFVLREAILRTFERRHTPIPNAAPPGLSDEFAVARSNQ